MSKRPAREFIQDRKGIPETYRVAKIILKP
jgi:hypothetical protein